jgi:cytochrome c5
MRYDTCCRLVLSIAALAVPGVAVAAAADRPGAAVYRDVCAACHATGAGGAPRVGDAKAWQPRYERGLASLSRSAIEGVRNMPPHGGNPHLTDLELERAIAYMVNRSGGHWTEPIDRARPPAARSGEYVVATQCAKCHRDGVNGAPRIGDKDAWVKRAAPGFDSLVRSAIAGHGGMPPRGGEADLTDEEMRQAITYMFQTSVKPAAKSP